MRLILTFCLVVAMGIQSNSIVHADESTRMPEAVLEVVDQALAKGDIPQTLKVIDEFLPPNLRQDVQRAQFDKLPRLQYTVSGDSILVSTDQGQVKISIFKTGPDAFGIRVNGHPIIVGETSTLASISRQVQEALYRSSLTSSIWNLIMPEANAFFDGLMVCASAPGVCLVIFTVVVVVGGIVLAVHEFNRPSCDKGSKHLLETVRGSGGDRGTIMKAIAKIDKVEVLRCGPTPTLLMVNERPFVSDQYFSVVADSPEKAHLRKLESSTIRRLFDGDSGLQVVKTYLGFEYGYDRQLIGIQYKEASSAKDAWIRVSENSARFNKEAQEVYPFLLRIDSAAAAVRYICAKCEDSAEKANKSLREHIGYR